MRVEHRDRFLPRQVVPATRTHNRCAGAFWFGVCTCLVTYGALYLVATLY